MPVTLKVSKKTSENEFDLIPSSGGLVSALNGVNKMDFRWIGWVGCEVKSEIAEAVRVKCNEMKLNPVYLSANLADAYYNGYCNGIIWPILHYVVDIPLDSIDEIYDAYIKVNMLFADAVYKDYLEFRKNYPKDPYIIWVHDYHLMLLPQMIRNKINDSNLRLMFFLHIPFPHPVIWENIAASRELLEGLLHCDIIGFHIFEYQKHFMNACLRELNVEINEFVINAKSISGIEVKTISCPIGINPTRFIQTSRDDEIKIARRNLRIRYQNKTIVLGVDRLDYMKGVYQKLKGIERFTEKYKEMKNEIVFIQLAIPSRQNVPSYQKLKNSVHQLVSEINGKSIKTPIIEHWDQSLDFKQLVTVYSASDICLITSVRDGMNLVAFEYVASQNQHHGLLLLSEFAGAERSLAHGVVSFNPWNPDEIADALNEALKMSKEEKEAKHKWAFNHVTKHTADNWANILISELVDSGY